MDELKNRISQLFEEATQCETIGVMLVDIDDFRWHNDSFGYDKGDETIDQIAQVISSSLSGLNAHWLR